LRLSQAGLADGLGVSALAVSSWETGKDNPSVGNFVRWADAVGYAVAAEGAPSQGVSVPRRGEPFDQFLLRRLTTGLAGARERMDWSQEMVGDALGVSSWSVHMWETAHRVPRVLRLIAWCHVVHCQLILVRRER
jgi:DNA-binding XRE family transcriptional regulator